MPDSWDDRLTDFLNRVMATAASNGDPRPLQEEYNRMLAEMPATVKKKHGLKPIDLIQKTLKAPR